MLLAGNSREQHSFPKPPRIGCHAVQVKSLQQESIQGLFAVPPSSNPPPSFTAGTARIKVLIARSIASSTLSLTVQPVAQQ
jgi:hypothetical protein